MILCKCFIEIMNIIDNEMSVIQKPCPLSSMILLFSFSYFLLLNYSQRDFFFITVCNRERKKFCYLISFYFCLPFSGRFFFFCDVLIIQFKSIEAFWQCSLCECLLVLNRSQ